MLVRGAAQTGTRSDSAVDSDVDSLDNFASVDREHADLRDDNIVSSEPNHVLSDAASSETHFSDTRSHDGLSPQSTETDTPHTAKTGTRDDEVLSLQREVERLHTQLLAAQQQLQEQAAQHAAAQELVSQKQAEINELRQDADSKATSHLCALRSLHASTENAAALAHSMRVKVAPSVVQLQYELRLLRHDVSSKLEAEQSMVRVTADAVADVVARLQAQSANDAAVVASSFGQLEQALQQLWRENEHENDNMERFLAAHTRLADWHSRMTNSTARWQQDTKAEVLPCN